MEIKTNERDNINIIEQDSSELKNKQLMENVLKKWLALQKTIKEEMTFEEIIIKHQKDEFNRLKEYFVKFYTIKLKNRKIFDEINNPQKICKLILENKTNQLETICNPIEDLLFLFRNNYDYIITLIGLISDDDEEDKILSLAELFSVQFYENILIPNPEKEELLILIYKLLEKEIGEMCCVSIDGFLEDDTFVGKFIDSFNKRNELTGVLLSFISQMISEIENLSAGNNLNLSLNDLNDSFKNNISLLNAKFFNSVKDIDIKDILYANIPKININLFKNKKQIDIDEDEDNEESSEEFSEKNSDIELNNNIEIKDTSKIDTKDKNDNLNLTQNNYNDIYMYDLNLDFLEEKFNKEENPYLKKFYLDLIEQIIDDENIFSNKNLFETLQSYQIKAQIKQIAEKYKKNFLFIKSKIDWLIQNLFDKIEAIPYSVRCICKLISIIIKNKFPSLNKYLLNSFIGKYFLNKCFFPLLNVSNANIYHSQILSTNTKNCLNIIINVLDQANKCSLFKSNIDLEFTIFNHYIIELIPILNSFYDKLIDIELPPILNNVVLNNKNLNLIKQENLTYNFFKANTDELFHLQCICYSFDDILFILSLINRNIQAFANLVDFKKFENIINNIKQNEISIKNNIISNNNETKFYLAFKEEKNPKFENITSNNKNIIYNINDFTSMHSSKDKNKDITSQKFKFGIKTILRGLNLLNNKDYSYLNMSFSTRNFFIALKYTLDDFGELNDDKSKKKSIPLKFFGEYIFNNKDLLEQKYINNDYELLYKELYQEELNNLNLLKPVSSLVISRDGMYIRCAEDLLQKLTYENLIININKDYIWLDKFIEEERIKVCFQFKDIGINLINENNNISTQNEKNTNKKIRRTNNVNPSIVIVDAEKCCHKKYQELNNDNNYKKDSNILIPKKLHCYSIKDFISKFSDKPWYIPEKMKIPKEYVKEDIINGERTNAIYSIFVQYKSIIKKHLKHSKINSLSSKTESAYNEIINKIVDYIMRQIYTYVYPKEQFKSDLEFYNQTKKLNWITPEHLDIKKVYINQLANAILWIKKIDERKSIRDKLYCISCAHNIINNLIKFSSGKNEEAGQDELTPIFQYIIIKAQPPRIYSNINYIKCFLEDEDLTGELGFLLSQMESATCFIMNMTYKSLKITEEEFNAKMKEENII